MHAGCSSRIPPEGPCHNSDCQHSDANNQKVTLHCASVYFCRENGNCPWWNWGSALEDFAKPLRRNFEGSLTNEVRKAPRKCGAFSLTALCPNPGLSASMSSRLARSSDQAYCPKGSRCCSGMRRRHPRRNCLSSFRPSKSQSLCRSLPSRQRFRRRNRPKIRFVQRRMYLRARKPLRVRLFSASSSFPCLVTAG